MEVRDGNNLVGIVQVTQAVMEERRNELVTHYATKRDLDNWGHELERKIDKWGRELESKMSDMESGILWKLIPLTVSLLVLGFTVLAFLSKGS